jgi:hypothetical protein
MAIAAWSANVVTSSICFTVNGRTSERVKARTPIGNYRPRESEPSLEKPDLVSRVLALLFDIYRAFLSHSQAQPRSVARRMLASATQSQLPIFRSVVALCTQKLCAAVSKIGQSLLDHTAAPLPCDTSV